MASKAKQLNVLLEGLFCSSLKLASPEMHDGEQIGTVQFMQRMLFSFSYINGSEKEVETLMMSNLDSPFLLSAYAIQ
ncbi:MAG TPA: hypothetical protein VI146_03435 [Nitrososphaeraceae archaeon]